MSATPSWSPSEEVVDGAREAEGTAAAHHPSPLPARRGHDDGEPPERQDRDRDREGSKRRVGGCTACGSVAALKDLDPAVVRRARELRRRRSTRGLGFLRADARPRK